MEDLRPFEQQLIDDYLIHGSATSRKGIWIRGHLREVKQDYPANMWHRWVDFMQVLTTELVAAGKCKKLRGTIINPGSYNSFVKFNWILNKLGLIKDTGIREPASRGGPEFQRSYYQLVPSKISSQAWDRPMQTLYPSTDWVEKRLTMAPAEFFAYRWKYRKPTGKPIGRPRGSVSHAKES